MKKDGMFYRFALYGFLKNLRFFDPFILLIFREAGLSFLQIGLLYSLRALATHLLEIPTGLYADAFGRRKSMVTAFSAYILSFLVFYLFSSFRTYAAAMVVFACGEAFRTGTHKALILEYLRLNGMEAIKTAYYGRTRAASQLGSAVNSLIAAGIVLYTGDYRYMFIVSTLPYALDLFNLATYPKELDGDRGRIARGAFRPRITATMRAFFALFTRRQAVRAILNSASFTAFFNVAKDYLQPILNTFAGTLPLFVAWGESRRAAVLIGLVYFVNHLLTSCASRGADRFSRRFSRPARAIDATFLAGAGFLFVAGAASRQHLIPLSILVFIGLYVLQNLRRPMNVAYISDRVSHTVTASAFSTESQCTTLLVTMLSPVLGALADGFGVGTALAILGAGMLLLSPGVRVGG